MSGRPGRHDEGGRERERERERERGRSRSRTPPARVQGRGRDSRSRSRDRDRDRDTRKDPTAVTGTATGRPRSRDRSRERRHRDSRSRSRSPPRRRKHSRSHSPSRSRSRSRSRERRRRRRSRSSSSSSSSASDDSHHRRKKRKHKHRKHGSRSRERKEKKREKKEKKHKKKKNKTGGASSSGAHWGKYGIISETDMHNKEPEFRTWLVEERMMNPEALSKDQTRKEFARFVEDFNTATLSHEKFYNMEVYERRMDALRGGEYLPPADDGYDPNADLMAHSSTHKRKPRETESYLSREQLLELRKVQNERVELGKMKALGMDIKQNFGVRMDGSQFED